MPETMSNLSVLVQGFLTGAALIMAIGSQNAFLLQQGLLQRFHWQIATLCSLIDTVLISAGIFGLGLLIKTFPQALTLISIFGIAFLAFYGYNALKSAMKNATLETQSRGALSLKSAILTTLMLSLLNPHVYLDTVLLIGSIGNQYALDIRPWFAAGAILASFVWFYALALAARWLAPLFKNPHAWRVLDLIVCLIMWSLAINLLLGLLVD